MPIDRDDYEPIEGNPRRTTKEDAEPEESGAEDPGEKGKGTRSGPGGDQPGGARAEDGTRGPEGTAGDQQRESDPSNGDSTGSYETPQGRTKRVKVTPQDWSALEEIAERLGGLPHSKVYNRAFEELKKKFDGP